MAAPNLASLSTITGLTTGAALTTSVTTSLLANSAASGKVLKVNSIIVTNISGGSATTTMEVYNGTNSYRIAYTLTVPVGATVILIDKNSYIYLPEGYSIRGGASAGSALETVISYEDLS